MRHNLSANLTKLFKKEAKTNPDDIIDDKTDNKSVLSLNSDIRENHLNSLMDKLLRGEETEGGFILNDYGIYIIEIEVTHQTPISITLSSTI